MSMGATGRLAIPPLTIPFRLTRVLHRNQARGKATEAPKFNQSKLTKLFQNFLCGNGMAAMVVGWTGSWREGKLLIGDFLRPNRSAPRRPLPMRRRRHTSLSSPRWRQTCRPPFPPQCQLTLVRRAKLLARASTHLILSFMLTGFATGRSQQYRLQRKARIAAGDTADSEPMVMSAPASPVRCDIELEGYSA